MISEERLKQIREYAFHGTYPSEDMAAECTELLDEIDRLRTVLEFAQCALETSTAMGKVTASCVEARKRINEVLK